MSNKQILGIQRANRISEQMQTIWDQLFEIEVQEGQRSDIGVLLAEAREKIEQAQEEALKTGRQWLNKK